MKALRTLIIDDERLARRACRHLLEACDSVDVIGEAGGFSEAKRLIEELRPDLIFLDIEMPGGNGIDLLSRLTHRPRVILVTAYEAYALKAFDVDVVDYLLKPIDPDRLRRALHRVESREALSRSPQRNAPEFVRPATDEAALSPVGSGNTYMNFKEILAVFADGNYTRILFKNLKEAFVRQSMRQWEAQLPGDGFVRLDRKMIVNFREIRSLKLGAHEAQFELNGYETPFSVGRNATGKLKSLLDLGAL